MPDQRISTSVDDLITAAIEGGGDPAKTGRFLMTFKPGAMDAGMQSLTAQSGFRVANARDFQGPEASFAQAGDADAVVFHEIGVALVGGEAAAARGLSFGASVAEDSPVSSIDPEYFMFTNGINARDYLKGVLRATQTIYADLAEGEQGESAADTDVSPEVLGVTWGLKACKVPPSHFSGSGIRPD